YSGIVGGDPPIPQRADSHTPYPGLRGTLSNPRWRAVPVGLVLPASQPHHPGEMPPSTAAHPPGDDHDELNLTARLDSQIAERSGRPRHVPARPGRLRG